MEFRELSADSKPYGGSARGEGSDTDRYSLVSDWFNAEDMQVADLSDEVAGQRVAIAGDEAGNVLRYSPTAWRGMNAGVSGFLFTGDDGDSLWFWPESEDMAFRFEPETASLLRRGLSEAVSSLVSQGALVFCQKIGDRMPGDLLFDIPAPEQNAA